MDQLTKREPREWPAQEYFESKKLPAFPLWLEKYEICTNGSIVSAGCGLGDLEADLAPNARHVLGIDASEKMISHAKKTHLPNKGNLFFKHCFAEDFPSQPVYDLAIASSCFNLFEDQPKAVKAIAKSLRNNGIFFANIETQSNQKSPGDIVFEELKQDYPVIRPILAMLPNPTGSYQPTYGELHIMLMEAYLTDIKSAVETYDWTMTAEEWRKAQLPLLLSRPGTQTLINLTSDNYVTKKAAEYAFWWISMSDEEKQQHDAPFFPESSNPLVEKIRNNDFCRYLFNNYFNRFLSKLQKNEDDTYTWKYETTIIIAQKKDNS